MPEGAKVRQVGLGAQLRRLRHTTGMTTRSVAHALDISPSSVNRTEMGNRVPDREEIGALCALYGVTGEHKLLLIDHADKGSRNAAWLEMSSKVSEQAAAMMVLEREATAITNLEVTFIPGLAQTPDYARLLLDGVLFEDQDLETQVARRLSRQVILTRPVPPEVGLIIDEGALHRTLGNARIVREQLEHLLIVQRRPNVTLRVIPLSAARHPGLHGPFAAYEVPGGGTQVFVESRNFGVFLTEPVDVEPFVQAWQKLSDHVLDEQKSAELIKSIIGRLSDE